jgi:dTDP-4-amino-4,6-dideoxygalactose transaminase
VAPPSGLDTSILLEDATGAVGATVDGRTVGSLGRAAVVRLGAAPFARSTGALVSSNDGSLVERLQADPRYQHPSAAGAGLWADAGLAQEWIEGCRAAAGVYDSVWRGAGLPVRPLEPAPRTEPTYSSYLVSVPDAGALALTLAARGVETCRPLAAPITRAGTAAVEFPGAVAFHRTALQLPNHPDVGLGELLYVADAVCVHLRGLVHDSGR